MLPAGRLYVECPNLYSPHSAPGRLFHAAHVYNFTPATLAMLCRSCGYDIKATLSGERDRNLRYLLTPATRADSRLVPDSYARTQEALSRYNALTYHFRWGYLRERIRGLARDLSDHWRAAHRVREIIGQCQSHQMRQNPREFETRRAA